MTRLSMGNHVIKHKPMLMFSVLAALLLALVVRFAPARNASADTPFHSGLNITGYEGGGDVFNFTVGVAVEANYNVAVLDRGLFDQVTFSFIGSKLRTFDEFGVSALSVEAVEPLAVTVVGSRDFAGDIVVVEGATPSTPITIRTFSSDGTLRFSFTVATATFGVVVMPNGDYILSQGDGGFPGSGWLATYSPNGVAGDIFARTDPLNPNETLGNLP